MTPETTARRTPPHPPKQLLQRLRKLKPKTPGQLSWQSAERLAASQASLLVRDASKSELAVDELIALLPVIRIERIETLPASGLTFWDTATRQWVMQICSSEPPESQRFSILHEFKHIIDHFDEHDLYEHRYLTRYVQAEMAADHFASRALMPAKAVRDAVRTGVESIEALAFRFDVTHEHAAQRLSDLALDGITTLTSPERRKTT